MIQSTAIPGLPTRSHTDEDWDVLPTATQRPTPSPEDLGLAEQTTRALRATGYGPLRHIEVSVSEQVIHLRGQVPSYHLKQMAQEIALAVPGPHHVRNALAVIPPDSRKR